MTQNPDSARRRLAVWLSECPNAVAIPRPAEPAQLPGRFGIKAGSLLGEIVQDYACILCCDRTVRLLGGQNPYCLSFDQANCGVDGRLLRADGVLLVADTACGGLFGLYAVPGDPEISLGEVLFLAPDSFVWEPVNIGYSRFVQRILHTDAQSLLRDGWLNNASVFTDFARADRLLEGKTAMLQSIRQAGEEA